MTVTEAAEVIGCHPRHVRALIANGKLKARRVATVQGYRYVVGYRDAVRYRNRPQSRGWPRGVSRNQEGDGK